MRALPGLRVIIVCLLAVGIAFRFVNLDRKLYSHDEVYTSLRAAGYTHNAIDQALFQNQVVPFQRLQQWQRLKPGSRVGDTIHSLAIENPQHPPLYFALARFWMQVFGSSLTASRSLPALLSLLSLPLMYLLAWELFASEAAALLSMVLLALSPFDVLFAQTARQYSLLTLLVIASQFLLLRALRLSKPEASSRRGASRQPFPWQAWVWYSLSVALGLYTHPFFALTIAAQMVYVALDAGLNAVETPQTLVSWRQKRPLISSLIAFGLALVGAVMLYAPWLAVLFTNTSQVSTTTDWARVSQGLDYLLKLWTLSFTSLFVDLDFGFNNPWTFLLRLPIVVLIGGSLYYLCRRCDRSVWLAIVTSIAVPFLLLALPDLIMGGKRSAVSRYLISCYPGIQLAVAYLLATQLVNRPQFIWRSPNRPLVAAHTPYTLYPKPHSLPIRRWFWCSVFALITVGSVVSCTTSALSDTWWNKDLSYANAEIARRINAAPNAIVISDIGDDFTNTGDLISLSYLVNPTVQLLAIGQGANWVHTPGFKDQIRGATALVFRPSQSLNQALSRSYGPLQSLWAEARLWQLPES